MEQYDKMRKLKLVVFISQSGGEIMKICETLQILPYYIVTNNPDKVSESVHSFFQSHGVGIFPIKNKPTEDTYKQLAAHIPIGHKIILSGYLRILPPWFCNEFEIYNGHPGLITKYPAELKGKDPQEKAFKLKHSEVGSVVHRVTEEVDGGEVIETVSSDIDPHSSLEVYYETLQETSLNCWTSFFRKHIL